MAPYSAMPPRRLMLSYILDWILLLCIAAVGGGVTYITPYHRPFSLIDLSISFPYVQDDLISTATLVVVSLVAPALIILILTAVSHVDPTLRSRMSAVKFWRLKLWEWHVGWLGLALSFVLALFITSGIKNIIGKPRPDLLARCQPDLTNVAAHVVGGFGQDLTERWALVSSTICTQTDKKRLDEGFRSFLSGHSSTSWSGLFYLALWLASKYNVTVPYFHPGEMIKERRRSEGEEPNLLPVYDRTCLRVRHVDADGSWYSRDQAAAPPIFGVILVSIPLCVAFYISSTRYVDFKHQGIDIFSGSVLGIATAWIGFRWYHGSLTRGQNWTWGARESDHAFGLSTAIVEWTGKADGTAKRSVGREDQQESAVGSSTARLEAD